MLLSKKFRFIFIHIYKNAGTSITNALIPFATAGRWETWSNSVLKRLKFSPRFDPQPFPFHIKASEIIAKIGGENFKSFFSFAFVRNPWDWQVSLYNYMLKETTHYQHHLVRGLGSFDRYIRWRCTEEVRLQRDFIYSADGELLIDYVGRFENLDADFQTICDRIGISTTLSRLNVSNSRPYQQFYNNETKELVRRTFEADITLFEYDF